MTCFSRSQFGTCFLARRCRWQQKGWQWNTLSRSERAFESETWTSCTMLSIITISQRRKLTLRSSGLGYNYLVMNLLWYFTHSPLCTSVRLPLSTTRWSIGWLSQEKGQICLAPSIFFLSVCFGMKTTGLRVWRMDGQWSCRRKETAGAGSRHLSPAPIPLFPKMKQMNWRFIYSSISPWC